MSAAAPAAATPTPLTAAAVPALGEASDDGESTSSLPSSLLGTNLAGSAGNSGACNPSICSVDAEYDWASFVISKAASARSPSYCDLAVFTEDVEGPPPWLPTSFAAASCASRIERAEALEFLSASICGLTSCSVSAAWPSHFPALSL
ncbi:hypothetical protein [Streptomyces sp. SGAir0957]